jgi:hypothetical protein
VDKFVEKRMKEFKDVMRARKNEPEVLRKVSRMMGRKTDQLKAARKLLIQYPTLAHAPRCGRPPENSCDVVTDG